MKRNRPEIVHPEVFLDSEYTMPRSWVNAWLFWMKYISLIFPSFYYNNVQFFPFSYLLATLYFHIFTMKSNILNFAFISCLNACASAQKVVADPVAACQRLGASLAIPFVTVNFAEYLPAGTNITLTRSYNLSSCGHTSQVVSNDICRVAMYVATSFRSGRLDPE